MQISDAEWIVMNLVWDEQPIEAREVIQKLGKANDWSDATIKTMLHRLVKKQALTHQADGKKYIYRSNVRRSDCIRKASRSFLKRVFAGDAAPALMHFMKNSRLSTDDVAELRSLLDSMEQKAKESDK